METTFRYWFRRFKNDYFDVEDKERSGGPKKFEDPELEAFLHEDACQAQGELAESSILNYSFETFESIRNGSKAKTLGAKRVEAERRQTASCHM